MRKLILAGVVGVASTVALANQPLQLNRGAPQAMGNNPLYVHNDDSFKTDAAPKYSIALGYAGSKLGSDEFLGTESFDGLFVNAEYQSHPTTSIWAEYKFQSSDVDYNQVAVGLKNKFLEDNKLYSAASIGIGMSWLDESETDFDLGRVKVELDYFTIPVALEVGYKITPQVDMFGAFGYQWMFNRDAKLCVDGDCISGNSDDLDLNGVTYNAGVRYKF